MPPLQNKLHERFAWLIAEGETQTEAYKKLMPHVNAPHVLGHKVYHRPEVKSRIAEIREEVATRSVMNISRKREILRQMVEGQFPTKVIRNKAGGIVAIFDRLAAMQMDAKLAGEFAPERHEIVASSLKLTFKIQGRNTRPEDGDVIEADIIEDAPQHALPEPDPAAPEVDFTQFEVAPMDLDQDQINTI
jgi:hypothetical protein